MSHFFSFVSLLQDPLELQVARSQEVFSLCLVLGVLVLFGGFGLFLLGFPGSVFLASNSIIRSTR